MGRKSSALVIAKMMAQYVATVTPVTGSCTQPHTTYSTMGTILYMHSSFLTLARFGHSLLNPPECLTRSLDNSGVKQDPIGWITCISSARTRSRVQWSVECWSVFVSDVFAGCWIRRRLLEPYWWPPCDDFLLIRMGRISLYAHHDITMTADTFFEAVVKDIWYCSLI